MLSLLPTSGLKLCLCFVISDEWSSSKLATCMSYSLYFGCTVSDVGYTLEEKWLLVKSCVLACF
jgi:hypothetical protein